MTPFELAERNKDFQSVEGYYNSPTFTWKGADYACIATSDDLELTLDRGGFSDIKTLNLSVRVNQFSDDNFPQSQDTITYRGVLYSIATFKHDLTDTLLNYVCVSDTRGS